MLIVKAFSILHLPYWIHNRFRLPTSDYVGMFYHEKARERVLMVLVAKPISLNSLVYGTRK
jgi:hypothetical protein